MPVCSATSLMARCSCSSARSDRGTSLSAQYDRVEHRARGPAVPARDPLAWTLPRRSCSPAPPATSAASLLPALLDAGPRRPLPRPRPRPRRPARRPPRSSRATSSRGAGARRGARRRRRRLLPRALDGPRHGRRLRRARPPRRPRHFGDAPRATPASSASIYLGGLEAASVRAPAQPRRGRATILARARPRARPRARRDGHRRRAARRS